MQELFRFKNLFRFLKTFLQLNFVKNEKKLKLRLLELLKISNIYFSDDFSLA